MESSMAKRIVFAALLGIVLHQGPAAAAEVCFSPASANADFRAVALDVSGTKGRFFSLVGELVVNSAEGPRSSPLAGTAFVRGDGRIAFWLTSGVGDVTGTLNPPTYTAGSVVSPITGGPVTITAAPCASL